MMHVALNVEQPDCMAPPGAGPGMADAALGKGQPPRCPTRITAHDIEGARNNQLAGQPPAAAALAASCSSRPLNARTRMHKATTAAAHLSAPASISGLAMKRFQKKRLSARACSGLAACTGSASTSVWRWACSVRSAAYEKKRLRPAPSGLKASRSVSSSLGQKAAGGGGVAVGQALIAAGLPPP